ncbi:MAG: hypothetical protein Q4Q23_02480 [Methanobacteriaceae archaeon]|nr:hypothetical protein [Methanobacteriaceae archaeon]
MLKKNLIIVLGLLLIITIGLTTVTANNTIDNSSNTLELSKSNTQNTLEKTTSNTTDSNKESNLNQNNKQDPIKKVTNKKIDNTQNTNNNEIGKGNFTELETLINSSNGTLNLDKDYIRGNNETGYTSGIDILNTITINGNGHTINGTSLNKTTGRIFYVENGVNLILNNITLTGSEVTKYNGAIYNKGILTITNSTLINNTAKNGGAIYNGGKTTIIDTILTDNTANYGGAINNEGMLNIINSTLYNNLATNDGGAIENSYGIITITNTTFNNNTAIRNGGVIDNYAGKITINSSIFTDNLSNNGTIMFTDGDGIISLNNNWWGRNDINNTMWNEFLEGVNTPDNHVIMTFTNTTKYNDIINLRVTLNTLNDTTKIEGLPLRQIIFNSTTEGVFTNNGTYFTESINSTYTGNRGTLQARIDDQILTVSLQKITNITLNNYTAKAGEIIKLNTTVNVVNSTENINGTVIFKINGKTIGNSYLINKTATLNYNIPSTFSAKNYTLTATYNENLEFTKSTTNSTLTITKTKTNIILDNVTTIKGNTTQFTATIKDEYGNLIKDGIVIFKINGKTLPNKISILNGTAIYQYTIPNDFSTKNYTITAIYAGNNKYEQSRTNATLIIIKLNATVQLSNITAYAGQNIILTANITDLNKKIINTGEVLFKINGNTLKYTNGTSIKVQVINGVATLNYNIPSNFNAKEYNITAVYSNKGYNRQENTSILQIKKSPATINITPITVMHYNAFNIKAQIINTLTQNPVTTGKVGIKINGKTIVNNLTLDSNGQINYPIINNIYKVGVHNITIMFNGGINCIETRTNSTLTVTPLIIYD